MGRGLTARGAQRRRELMEAAVERFAANGYHPTSVAQIVDHLGVGKGVFYWYFSSKEELLREILRDAHRDLRRSQQRAIDATDDPVERIEAGVRASMRWLADHPERCGLMQFASTEDRFADAIRRGEEVAVADASRHLRAAMATGRVPDADPEMLAQAMLGVTGQLAQRYLHGAATADDVEAAVTEVAVAFCLGGVSSARSAANPR